MRNKPVVAAPFLASVACFTSAACAQWTAVLLHPPGAVSSHAMTNAPGTQAGRCTMSDSIPGLGSGCVWTSSAESFELRHPTGTQALGSSILALQHDRYLGVVSVASMSFPGSAGRAASWGDSGSWTNLHTPGATHSVIYGASGDQQVGTITYGELVTGARLASLWYGTAASRVSLHPAVASESYAYAVQDGVQGGNITVNGVRHAALWFGSANSWISLNPSGTSGGTVYAIDGGRQAGSLMNHAALWSGTADSWQSLHPEGWESSVVYSIAGEWQAGQSTTNACVWRGTPESRVDLSVFLPFLYSNSVARSIAINGSRVEVAGWARNNTTNNTEAILWIGDLCPADFDNNGAADVPDIFAFLSAWFANDPRADFDGVNGVGVADIFAFLIAWFAGC